MTMICSFKQSPKVLKVGDKTSMKKSITEQDIFRIAELIGDYNPVHIDEDFAMSTRFKGRIAHGELITGLISALVGNILPGHGSIFISQNVRFLKPARPNDTITATVEIVSIREDKPIIHLNATCTNQNDQVILEGNYVVLNEKTQKLIRN
jgi:3-hydroxybutyryl-CoA dehydratase